LAEPARYRAALLALVIGIGVGAAGCGSSSPARPTSTRTQSITTASSTPAREPRPARLEAAGAFALPAARSGIAAAAFGSSIVAIGGLSPAGVSTTTVFRIDGRGVAGDTLQLPSAVHDAAAEEISGRLLLFGGGRSEGSDRIVAVLPAPPRLIGRLPQALSDLDAVPLGEVVYVVGGWNGSLTNREIYAVRSNGTVTHAGNFPTGVRYPAAGAVGGRLILAGGETTSGDPTSSAWSFDPATGRLARLPDLPFPTDHAAGASLAGRFYVVGGLRRGLFTSAVLSWAPGESHWHAAGQLPAPLADLAAVPFNAGIAVVGGRGPGGPVSTVTLMKAR
jgi:hypothetical protein